MTSRSIEAKQLLYLSIELVGRHLDLAAGTRLCKLVCKLGIMRPIVVLMLSHFLLKVKGLWWRSRPLYLYCKLRTPAILSIAFVLIVAVCMATMTLSVFVSGARPASGSHIFGRTCVVSG